MLSVSVRLDLQKVKALVVDDSPPSLELLSQVLLGFRIGQVMACRTPEEALAALRVSPFDLIVIDGEMPSADGIAITAQIRRQSDGPNFTAPIIVVSGHTPLDKVLRARDAGANIVVKKPITPAVLLSRIDWLARNTRQFINVPSYAGPDRRFKNHPLPEGIEERRSDAIALIADPTRAMSQNEVDSLFG